MKEIFGHINYLAVIGAAIAYWLVGMIWFSALFGEVWSKEIHKQGIKIQKPTPAVMATKSLLTFLYNLIACLAISIIFTAFNVTSLSAGIGYGLVFGIGFAATAMLAAHVWVSRSFKLSLIEVGYPIIGITVAAMIIAIWR